MNHSSSGYLKIRPPVFTTPLIFQGLPLPWLSLLHALTVFLAVAPPFPFPAIHLCLHAALRRIFSFFSFNDCAENGGQHWKTASAADERVSSWSPSSVFGQQTTSHPPATAGSNPAPLEGAAFLLLREENVSPPPR